MHNGSTTTRPRPVAVTRAPDGGYVVERDDGTRDFLEGSLQGQDPGPFLQPPPKQRYEGDFYDRQHAEHVAQYRKDKESHIRRVVYYQQLLKLVANGTAHTAPSYEPKPQAAPVTFIDADEDTEPLDWPGEWAPDEEGRIWLATGQGEYTLLAGLPGRGKSHLAQELAAREREAGGHPLAILPEASNSWRHRNRQLPAKARVDIVAGVPDLDALRDVLVDRATGGKPWPTLIVVDPATLAVGQWADSRRDGSTYDYPTVSRAVAALEEATTSPDGNRPKLIWCVHTPETEQGGRGKRAVGGYTQGAGVGYLLPQLGKVTVLKPPRDCPEELPPKPMLYTLEAGRISYHGQATRDLSQQAGRILDRIGESGAWGITKRQLRDGLKGIGETTLKQVIPDLLARKLIHETTDTGVTGTPITRYTTEPPRFPRRLD